MVDMGFNKIFVLIGICIYIQLDVVLLQTPGGSAGDRKYFELNTAGDLAVQMKYESKPGSTMLNVSVFYDAKSDSANHYFGKQITSDLLTNAKKCPGINFMLCPCSFAKGEKASEANLIQICVAKALSGDGGLIVDFITCYSTAKNKADVDVCLNQIKVNRNNVNTCVDKQGTQICLAYNNNFHVAQVAGGERITAIEDFKNALCTVLKNGPLKCPSVCGNQ